MYSSPHTKTLAAVCRGSLVMEKEKERVSD